jgi:hypothetical protein
MRKQHVAVCAKLSAKIMVIMVIMVIMAILVPTGKVSICPGGWLLRPHSGT